ncbi:alpha/beta hydrolase family protein [Caulobacter hibisci]|uniref:S9 family peptidase n=1 Tax=Caulobacter hibisci TaxID=2035993 RepID=A0ABS0T5L2_9CAUL|nr:prolyl oligopeptidase family serine peptidase [Caulobacter hibisci]MBI1686791.1 S9 family peptidase [Caulobacter hibisci]
MRSFAGPALACALAATSALAGPAPQAASQIAPKIAAGLAPLRPYTIDDMLGLEQFGRAVFSGDGRRLVFERQGPWTAAGRWDLDWLTPQRTSRLYVVDLGAGAAGEPARLLTSEDGVGETLGALSPDGRRLIVYRLKDRFRELGVVELATGQTLWSGLMVEPEVFTAQARWRSDREVVAIATTPDTPSFLLGRGWQGKARQAAAWRAAEDGATTVTVLKGGAGATDNPRWPEVSLAALDVETGKVRPLARGPFFDLRLSPDGRTAALTALEEPVTIDAQAPVENNAFDRRRRLVLVDLASGQVRRPCAGCDMVGYLMSWSPDGREVIIAARPDDKAGDWRRVRYWRLSVDGDARLVDPDLAPGALHEAGGTTLRLVPDAGWIGTRPVVLAAAGGDTAAWWRVDADRRSRLTPALPAASARRTAMLGQRIVVRGDNGLIPLGRSTPLVTDSTLSSPFPVLPGDLPGVVLATDKDRSRLLTAGDSPRPAAVLPADTQAIAAAPATGAVLALSRSRVGVASLVLAQRGQPLRTLAKINTGLEQIDAAPPTPIVHQTPRGETVTSWLYRPTAHGPGDHRPLIVVPYPGSSYIAPPAGDAPDAQGFAVNVRAMVGAGYAVLVPSLPIAPTADPAEGLGAAILAAVDAALAADPGLSRTRLAVWGQSFGGFGALTAATQASRFKAVVASAATVDFYAMYGAQGATAITTPEVSLHVSSMFGWAEAGQGRMLAPPWRDPARYGRASPLLFADRITAPVLLIEGDSDIHSGQAMEMFTALYRQGKPVELLAYGGEGHVVISPANVRDVYGRAFAFLQAVLGAEGSSTPAAGASEAASPRASQ